jgi:hypothetical protein
VGCLTLLPYADSVIEEKVTLGIKLMAVADKIVKKHTGGR